MNTAAFLLFAAMAGQTPQAARPQVTPDERQARAKQQYEAELAKARPIAAHDTVWLEEMTYLEARDAIRGGKSVALIFAGSTEQNGPYLPGSKHQHALRAVGEQIARKLGNALIAPIVPIEAGNPDNPYINWGSLYFTRETFEGVIRDMASSLKSQGFTHIILMGDSGGDTAGLRAVAQELSAKWGGTPAIHHVPEFYNWTSPGGVRQFVKDHGISENPTAEGIHDEYGITAALMAIDPALVRFDQRVAANKATINGIDITPKDKTIEMGRKIIEFRANVAVAAIRKVIGQ
jgi:creatinine amidohydrolase